MRTLILVFALTSFSALSQQELHFTQYMDNTIFLNPAYAGSRDLLTVVGIHREQWTGFDGRPRSSTFSIHSPVGRNVGLGVDAVNDIIGPVHQVKLDGNFSYTLNFKNTRGKLAFGVKGGYVFSQLTTSEISTTNPDDFLIGQQASAHMLNFGVGVYYHTPKFYVGLSTPRVLESDNLIASNAYNLRHYFFIAGGIFDLSRSWKFRPTTHVKFVENAPISTDLTATFVHNERLWLGVSYRLLESFAGIAQFQLTPQFKIGLAYEESISAIRTYNSGTFEALLSYDFVFDKAGLKSPRYF